MNFKKIIKNLLKILLVVGLFYFLWQKKVISVTAMERAFSHPAQLIPAMGVFFLGSVLGTIRWQWLLRAQGIHMSWLRTLELTLVGLFFNTALPGAVTGDVVKAYYVGKEVGGQGARAFGSILFDRVAGVSALAIISATALCFGGSSLWGSPLFLAIRVFVLVSAAGVLFFYAYLFLVREHHDPVLRIFKALESRFSKLGAITRTYLGLRHYHSHRGTVLKVLGLSVVLQLMIGWACLQFAIVLGDSFVQLVPVYVVVPLGILVTAVPVAPGGIGTGHAAFFYLFRLIGSERGADVFSLMALSGILVGVVGGLVYLRFRVKEPIQ